MTWNYRIIRSSYPDGYWYALHEAYYYDQEINLPDTWTENPVDVSGDTPEEVILTLRMMLNDAAKYEILCVEDDKIIATLPAPDVKLENAE